MTPVLLVDDNVEFVGLLGTLFEEQGLLPHLAHSGTAALFECERRRHAAIVLDLLLPDTTGQRLLTSMLERGWDLPPVFVMTGVFKGDNQRTKVEGVHGIAGWYEKPFDTRLLVEKVVATIGRDVVARGQHQPVGQVVGDYEINILEPSDDLIVDIDLEEEDVVQEPLIDLSVEQPYWESETAAPLGLPEEPTAKRMLPPRSADLGELSDDDPSMVTVMPGARPPPTPPPPPPKDPFADNSSGFGANTTPSPGPSPAQVREDLRTSLRSGDLATTTVPRLINAFYIAQETGEIAFERANQRKVVYFEKGRPVYAVSNQETDRMAVFVKRVAGITHKQLIAGLNEAKATRQILVDVLIDRGFIGADKRQDLLREQTRGLVRSLFTWTSGRYVVGFNADAATERVELQEHPGALVLAGIRDLFELRRLRELLADELCPIPAPNPPFGLEELPLGDAEAVLLLQVTGSRTVRELVENQGARLDERAVRATLYALLCLGVFGLVPG